MYPKSIKINKQGKIYEYLYRPGHHESTFEVSDLAGGEVVLFEFDAINHSFSFAGVLLDGIENLIGNFILRAEF